MKISQSFTLPFSSERIAEVLCDAQFNIARDRLREGVVHSEFRMVSNGQQGQTLLIHEVDIFVWIPVIGYYIMKLIADELETLAASSEALIIAHAAGTV